MKRKTDNFNKFFHKKRNSAIKEEFRQEKKAIKRERKEAIERHFEEKRRLKYKPAEEESGQKAASQRTDRKTGGVPKKKEGQRTGKKGPEPAREKHAKPGLYSSPSKGKAPVGNTSRKHPESDSPAKHITLKPLIAAKSTVPSNRIPAEQDPLKRVPAKSLPVKGKKIPAKGFAGGKGTSRDRLPSPGENLSTPARKSAQKPVLPVPVAANTLPLNKYIAHGGICSRRDAADLIRQGKVQVNGNLVTEPGTKVSPEDQVKVNGKKVTISRNFVYILLNKPKDYITTTEDPQGRRTVLDLIKQATSERVYPIGRLDRNTSGVLLLTNDGELAQKLAHPKHEVRKIYHVVLDKSLTRTDFDKIVSGVTLEDGIANIDAIAYADAKDKTQIGLEIHSGRNRIVRRIFEHLGYDVKGLDRVMYAGLTKKNVQRGEWRLLSEKEIRLLKYMNSSTR